MEPSSSRHRSSTVPINSLGRDTLLTIFSFLDHYDLARCSAVCVPWKTIISTSTLIPDLYFKNNPHAVSSSFHQNFMHGYLQGLAMEDHRLAMSSGKAEIHHWTAHSARVNLCRMKRGLILTGVGDKVLRLWSAESYKCLDEFSWSNKSNLIDLDFDENKIVGSSSSQICIWRYNRHRSVFQSRQGIFTRGLCMRYIDPEAAIGCEDGRACIFDLYSGSCSRIIRMHGGPVTSLALTEENMIFGGSSFGTVAVADLSTGERLAVLKSAMTLTGMKSLCVNFNSSLLFAGSTYGYAHCWDLRTLRLLWERRVSPNVIYATHHLATDSSTLAVGGQDGVLRILSQSTGELISSYIMDSRSAAPSSNQNMGGIQKMKARTLPEDAHLDRIDRLNRPPISCLAVGMKKIVTTHNSEYVRMWKFHEK